MENCKCYCHRNFVDDKLQWKVCYCTCNQDLLNRIEKLEKFNDSKIDSILKSFQKVYDDRLLEHEKNIKINSQGIENLNLLHYYSQMDIKNIFDQLEKKNNSHICLSQSTEINKLRMDLERLITDLEKRIKEIERYQEITHLEYLNRNKKPLKCPVCDGKKVYQSTQSTPPYVLHNSCTSCEGKGIVWE